MTLQNPQQGPTYPPPEVNTHNLDTRDDHGHTMQTLGHEGAGHGAHRLMMLACCVPMIAVVVLLVATGAANAGAFVWALGCLVMMGAMMFMMPGGHDHK
jgi:hypothetical protein